jgi:hypothetical protein
MERMFYRSCLLFSVIWFGSFNEHRTQKNVLDVKNTAEATMLIKVLNKELGLSEQQKVRIEKLFEAYLRRVELAHTTYADNREQLKKRLELLSNYRNQTFKKELGEEKFALFEMMQPELPKKIAEMNKRIAGK